jgi:hypothetical protein
MPQTLIAANEKIIWDVNGTNTVALTSEFKKIGKELGDYVDVLVVEENGVKKIVIQPVVKKKQLVSV